MLPHLSLNPLQENTSMTGCFVPYGRKWTQTSNASLLCDIRGSSKVASGTADSVNPSGGWTTSEGTSGRGDSSSWKTQEMYNISMRHFPGVLRCDEHVLSTCASQPFSLPVTWPTLLQLAWDSTHLASRRRPSPFYPRKAISARTSYALKRETQSTRRHPGFCDQV